MPAFNKLKGRKNHGILAYYDCLYSYGRKLFISRYLVYKSIVVECSTGVEDLAKAIEKKSEEMLNKGYKLVTMSMVGTDKAILVFKI